LYDQVLLWCFYQGNWTKVLLLVVKTLSYKPTILIYLAKALLHFQVVTIEVTPQHQVQAIWDCMGLNGIFFRKFSALGAKMT